MTQGTVDTVGVARLREAMTARRAAEHQVYEALAEIAGSGVAAQVGYRSEARLVEDVLRVNHAEATRMVRRAGDLTGRVSLSGESLPPRLPATAAAHAVGALSEGHVAIITDAVEHLGQVPGLDPAEVVEAEAALARHASRLSPAGLVKVARELIARLDPDGVAPEDAPIPDDEVHVARRRRGGVSLTMRLYGDADAEMVVEVLDALSGRAGPEDTRTLPERQAEAVKDLFAQAQSPTGIATDARDETPTDLPTAWDTEANDDDADHDADGADGATEPFPDLDTGEPEDTGTEDTRTENTGTEDEPGPAPGSSGRAVPGRALVAVTMDLQWLRARVGHGLLDSGTTISPETARRLACDAGIVPTVLGTRAEPLDVGRLSYTVPESLRRALALRDGGCAYPGCTRRPRRCHAHHLEHWIDGGPTCLANTCLLCRFHHQWIHHGHWTITMIHGRPWFTPPAWIDPTREPRPGGRFPVLTG